MAIQLATVAQGIGKTAHFFIDFFKIVPIMKSAHTQNIPIERNVIMEKGFMDWEFEEIYNYCKEHNELAWLKATGSKMVEVKVYPRIKVQKVDENGNPIFKEGKPVYASVADKSQEPKIELRRITFVQIKTEFLEKFGLAPKKKDKKPTMYDILDAI